MNKDKRSTMQYSHVTAPARTTLHLPYGVGGRGQMKAKLSVWEGEGGAIDTPRAAASSRMSVEDSAAETAPTMPTGSPL